MIVDYDFEDDYVSPVPSKAKIERVVSMFVSEFDCPVDQIVETSTFAFGSSGETPGHDLFSVTSPALNTTNRAMEVVSDYLKTFPLGKTVDFGSGVRRRYCDQIDIVEHVEWKSVRTECTCGCATTPYATPFYKHKELNSFIAINSLQNNSYSFIQRLLAQVKIYELNFVIVQPTKLGADEFDATHLIHQMFSGVRTAVLSDSMFGLSYFPNVVQYNVEVAKTKSVEVCVSDCGVPIDRDAPGLKQSVLVFCFNSQNEILVVEQDKGPVDFICAGHVTYGETHFETAQREWAEEMVSPCPFLDYYGYVSPPVSVAKAYVYVCRLDNPICVSSRGFVRPLVKGDRCRHDFYPAIRALSTYFPLKSSFDLDQFCSSFYSRTARKNYKRVMLDKYGSKPQFSSYVGEYKIELWPNIYKRYKKEFHSQSTVAAQDLKNRFKFEMRSTNQSARIYSSLSPGAVVILNADNHVPSPIVTLEFNGRNVGYCVYIREANGKRCYRVVECDYPVNCVDEPTLVNYTFRKAVDVELTDTVLGASLLAAYKGISREEATALIRSGMGWYKIWND